MEGEALKNERLVYRIRKAEARACPGKGHAAVGSELYDQIGEI